MTIKTLVIEDNAITAIDIQEILKKNDHQVVGWARNSEEAYRLFMDHKPDLLLVDIKLRGSNDGVELVQQINQQGDDTPKVIFITASSDRHTRQRAMDSGSVSFLTKPFDEQDLLDAIRKVFS
ncbi:response regulator [Marinoscillum sp.]|uniref:response regulator n=1 Tax=Marinoscillum sp. TaxID=2024838 RepID=UPI003BAC70ED